MSYKALPSLISSNHMFSNDTWAVSICRDTNTDQNPLHVFLIIEGLENHLPFLHYAHLVQKAVKNPATGQFIPVNRSISAPQGYAQVLLNENLPRNIFLAKAKTYCYKTFAVPQTSVHSLIKKIKDDVLRTKQNNIIPYNIAGQAKFSAISYGSRGTHNCVSYMQSLLVNWKDEQGIYVLDKEQRNSLYPQDFSAFLKNLIVVTHPRDILPEEQEALDEIQQQGSGNCLLM